MKKAEKTWQERYSEYEALCSEAAEKQGIERYQAYAKCDQTYRDLMAATDAPKTLNQASNKELPDTEDGIKELFEMILQKADMLGHDSSDMVLLREWKKESYSPRIKLTFKRPVLQGRFNRLVELSNVVQGVSIRDIGLALEYTESDLPGFVKRFHGSKKITAKPIGKCPNDMKAKLYVLSEILSDFMNYSPVSRTEMQKILKHLKSVKRTPIK